jgi:3alpha(or 20beta)-hydroxysteroid dehydrogenase
MAEETTMEVKDLSIMITGGARGIGGATSRLLAEGGAQVMLTDILDDEGAALAESLGPNVRYRHLNVAQPADWEAAVAAAEEAFGKLNALFNNAGILSFASVRDCTVDEFRRVQDINVLGVFLGIKTCAPAIRRAGGGAIVNNSSTAGMQGYAGIAAYVASKWAVRGLTKAAALDLARDGIRVVSLHPGPIRTPMTDGLPREMAEAQPLPRFGEPDEVAVMARFLLCEATYSTGTEFVVDGGAIVGRLEPVLDA